MSPLAAGIQPTMRETLPANPTPTESSMSPLDALRDATPGMWLLRYAMLNLTGWLLLFGVLLLLAYYIQEGGIHYIEQ